MPTYTTTPNATHGEKPVLPAPRPKSYATWVTDHAADALSSGRVAGLRLDVPRLRHDGHYDRHVSYYTVYAEGGCYHMLREGENGQLDEHYIVDPTFDLRRVEHWTCMKANGHRCPSHEKPACKHRRALRNGLAYLGLIPDVK